MFPTISSTIIPHMQQIKFHRGDSFDIKVQIQDDGDPASVVGVYGAVLRFASKLGYGTPQNGPFVGNEGAFITKRSYTSDQIEMVNPSQGRVIIKIQRGDTIDHPLIPMVWDLEITVPVGEIPALGKVITVPGDFIVHGIATGFDGVVPGDIITVEGIDVMVMENLSSALRTDFDGWRGGIAIPYSLHRGNTRTVASGNWTCVGDVMI